MGHKHCQLLCHVMLHPLRKGMSEHMFPSIPFMHSFLVARMYRIFGPFE